MVKRKYGWKRQSYDHRDLRPLKIHFADPATLPPAIDFRNQYGILPYDQGQYGSCVSNGVAFCHQYQQNVQGEVAFNPSRFFIYWNCRVADGAAPTDDPGTTIRCGMDSIHTLGVCPETEWLYVDENFSAKPTDQCFTDAMLHQSVNYFSLNNDNIQIKSILAKQTPVVLGITVYPGFELDSTTKTGIVSMPHFWDAPVGGHCVVLVGYDDSKQWFIMRNSWGLTAGDGGFYYLPYRYIQSYGSDLWYLGLVE